MNLSPYLRDAVHPERPTVDLDGHLPHLAPVLRPQDLPVRLLHHHAVLLLLLLVVLLLLGSNSIENDKTFDLKNGWKFF